MKVLEIYTRVGSNKLEYLCDFVFTKCMGLKYIFLSDLDEFRNSKNRLKICYSERSVDGTLHIPESGYFRNFEIEREPDTARHAVQENGEVEFDVFAAIFYILTRVEEYGTIERDVHDRFKADQSLLFRKGWIQYPIVDYWINELRDALSEQFNCEIKNKDEYRFLSTVDIDHIYAYRKKPPGIVLGSMLKDIVSFQWGRIMDRFGAQDPYDTFEEIIDIHQSFYMNPVFFVLCADRGPFDKTFDHRHPDYIEKVNYINKYYSVGIHPSYASALSTNMLQHEKMKLESVINEEIDRSRQHYLKFKLPESFRNLIDMGIGKEYSMGFHETVGFRAGTSRIHYWYDIEADACTRLKIYPFQAMDITLKKYMNLDTDTAFEACKLIIDRIRDVGGVFSLIWHNSSFYSREGWQDWKELYIRILKYAKP